MKVLIFLLLFASIASADMLIFNTFNVSEYQIGVMGADSTYSSLLVKGSLTEGQPISFNGTTGGFSGQIGYLSMEYENVTIITPPSVNVTSNQSITQQLMYFGGKLGGSNHTAIFAGFVSCILGVIVFIDKKSENQ